MSKIVAAAVKAPTNNINTDNKIFVISLLPSCQNDASKHFADFNPNSSVQIGITLSVK